MSEPQSIYIDPSYSADAKPSRIDWRLWLLSLVLLAVVGLLATVAYMSRWSLSSAGWALMGGLVAMTGIVSTGAVIQSRRKKQDQSIVPLSELFSEHHIPFLITREEKPVAANRAYLDLFGDDADLRAGKTGYIPPIDLLVGSEMADNSKALYQLHNMPDHSSTEIMSLIRLGRKHLGEADVVPFDLRVSGLGTSKLWEIIEKTPEKAKAHFHNVPIGLLSFSTDGKIVDMNEALRAWIGENADKASKLSDIVDNPDILLGGEPKLGMKLRAETRLKTSDVGSVPVAVLANWLELADGSLLAVCAIHGHSNIAGASSDSSTSNAVAQTLAASTVTDANISYRGLNHVRSPMAAIELSSAQLGKAKVIRANRAFEALMGRKVDKGEILLSLIKTDADTATDAAIETTLSNEASTPVSVYIAPNHALKGGGWAYIVDISARRSLESQLSQSQKMQAIGQLAAGVAHDFNNILQAIRLNADELLGRHPVGDPSYPELQKINSNVSRSAALVSKLLAFSRQQTLRPVVLNVTEAMSDIMQVLRQVMVERIRLDIVYGRNVPDILADKSQLETVLMNLCVNARDAMAEKGQGGQITITTERLDRRSIEEPGLVHALSEMKTDNIAVISVADTGTGMPPEVIEKIFEPFFTTKELGKGTGLGLATVYGIVQQSGGHLAVDSVVGKGTTFSLYFPEVDAEKARAEAEARAAIPKRSSKKRPSDLAGQGNILFVEDEDNVRVIAAKTLRKRGYQVVEACDGEEALEILSAATTPFDMLISDVVMPEVDGPTLLKRGKVMLGDARIVFISGYAEEDFSDLLAEYPDVSFLPKPFTLSQLAEKVKEEIGEATV